MFKIFLYYVHCRSFKKLDTFSQLSQLQTLRDDRRLRKWTVGEKAGNRFPLAGVFSWRVLNSALAKSNLYCGCRLLDWSGNRADCPILVKYQKICEGHLRLSPVAQTDDASGSMYFGGKWGLPEQVQSTVSGDWLLLFLELKVMFMFSRRFVSPYHCFLLEFGHGIYYISYGTDSAHGDRRKTQDDCRHSTQPRPR